MQKTVAAIHDISGFGKCSLTVALPILSAAGISTSIMPTAVLSSPTGGFDYTYRDLTDDLKPFMSKWKAAGLSFDAMFSGFLGSFEQLEIVGEFFDTFKTAGNIVLVDPAMADNGEFYSVFDPDFAKGMKKLCKKADIIVPNITEAAFLLDEPYRDGPYDKAYIEKLLRGLKELGPKFIVLTGVYFDGEKLGAACYDVSKDEISYALTQRVGGFYHGTGDIFASTLLASLLNSKPLCESAQIAAEFVKSSISATHADNINSCYGISFEKELPWLIKRLGLI